MITEKPITFYVPKETKEFIKHWAHVEHMNMSEFIRNAINEYVKMRVEQKTEIN